MTKGARIRNIAKREQRKTAKPKTAAEALTARFNTLIEEQAATMNDEEFKAAEREFDQVIERVRSQF